jgi:hypothetical protein
MMSSVITVENLGKRYSLANTAAPAYSTLRDVMADAARRFSGASRSSRQGLRRISGPCATSASR